MQLVILGTSASTPTPNRGLSSNVIHFNGKNYLFDAPENVQRQLMKAEVSYMKVDTIFFSHYHADHILGLPGLLATFAMQERSEPLTLIGPKGLKRLVDNCQHISGVRPVFPIKIMEGKTGLLVKEKDFTVRAFPLQHDCPCMGYVFEEITAPGKFVREKAVKLGIPEGPLWRQLQEGKSIRVKGKTIKPEQVLDLSQKKKGKKIGIVMDTKWTYNPKLLQDCDVLIHEATFSNQYEDRAKETNHCTAMQAATIARKMNVKQLILTHISARHDKTPQELENEAKNVFSNVKVANDLERIDI